MLADAAVLTVGERTISFSRAPIVPPLDQVSAFKELLAEIDGGGVSAVEADRRLKALEARPPHFSRAWQVVGLGLFATGFGISVQATRQDVFASAVLGVLVGLIAVAAQRGRGSRWWRRSRRRWRSRRSCCSPTRTTGSTAVRSS